MGLDYPSRVSRPLSAPIPAKWTRTTCPWRRNGCADRGARGHCDLSNPFSRRSHLDVCVDGSRAAWRRLHLRMLAAVAHVFAVAVCHGPCNSEFAPWAHRLAPWRPTHIVRWHAQLRQTSPPLTQQSSQPTPPIHGSLNFRESFRTSMRRPSHGKAEPRRSPGRAIPPCSPSLRCVATRPAPMRKT